MSYPVCYILWAALFALSAFLGFTPAPEKGAAEAMYMLAAGAVFVPGWLILIRANKEENEKHKKIVRNLCIASIVGTVVLLSLNLMSAGWSEQVGNGLHAALIIVSAPMVCGQSYALSLFMWGILLMGSMSKTNTYRR